MSYRLKVIRDNPVGFWPLDESNTAYAYDNSGCGNDGFYSEDISLNFIMPLIPGGESGTKIAGSQYITFPVDKDYYTDEVLPGFATANNPKESFSIELWIYPKIGTSETPIFADVQSDTGVFYENGNIVFKVEGQTLEYSIPNINRSVYVVCVYKQDSMSIYLDGDLAISKNINSFLFTSENITFQTGPVIEESDYFIIDGIAVYRYALPAESIKDHYSELYSISAVSVAWPDSGSAFNIKDSAVNKKFTMEYPFDKPWGYIATSPLQHDTALNCISLIKGVGAEEASFLEAINIPSIEDTNHSTIEWDGDNGITVEVSQDNDTFYECQNGMPIPLDDPELGIFYLRVTFTSADTARFTPRLFGLRICFFDNPIIYAANGPEYISSIGAVTNFGFTSESYPILSRDSRNGIRTVNGFAVNTSNDVYSVEMIYSPESSSASSIVEGLSWSENGTLTKNGISAIYINGDDRTDSSNFIQLFPELEISHVVIVFDDPITGAIKFNENGSQALYQNIALYTYEISQPMALEHFDLYTQRPSFIASDSDISMTESSVTYYNNDWVVVQNQ
jgi:hypothetical protein